MNSHIFSFVECGHRVSKHVDGHNSDRWDKVYNINTIVIVKIKVKMVKISYNIDVAILVALI